MACHPLLTKISNFERLGYDRRLPLSSNSTTLLKIFSIVGCDNILPRLSMVHDGFIMWEKPIEAPVEDTSGDKGVDVANIEALKSRYQHSSSSYA